jgi:hypothetical protein
MAKTPEAGSNACTERVTPTRTSEELTVCLQLAGAAAVFPGNWKAAAAVGSITNEKQPIRRNAYTNSSTNRRNVQSFEQYFAAMREGITC